MSKAIFVPDSPFTANGTLTLSMLGVYSGNISVVFSGSFGGGTIVINAGIPGIKRPIDNQDPITVSGCYTFDINCDEIDFVLTGATTPGITVVVFPRPRP